VTDEFIVTHNTLSAIEIMEQSGFDDWWWVGPKSGLKAVEREFQKWGLTGVNLELMTYEALLSKMKNWVPGMMPPHGLICDESSRLKNHQAQRSQAAQKLADGIREAYGNEGFVIEMSGTPSPKSPVDWWSQCEIAAPGFLREGSMKMFERRLGVFAEKETSQGKHLQRVAWLDDENKCAVCGGYEDEEQHNPDLFAEDYHKWEPSFNEVAFLNERLQGLALVLHKKDCLDLPEKVYRTVECAPTPTTERVAKALVKIAPNAITGLTWLRELSDGFQYREETKGTDPCPVCGGTDNLGKTEVWCDPEDEDRTFEMIDMLDPDYAAMLEKRLIECPTCEGTAEVPHKIRVTREVPCPKDKALLELLDENEDQGRLVVFTGFTGSVDRIVKLCLRQKWAVVKVDGRGWKVWDMDGESQLQADPLEYWANTRANRRVVFVAHPRSGGMGLTLTESRMAVFYSNDFNPESRSQAEDRIHRLGTDENLGATIVDLIHLPTDARVRDILRQNRKLELMTMGDLEASVGVTDKEE
jgi:SNF2 family DNA or RNA helicase